MPVKKIGELLVGVSTDQRKFKYDKAGRRTRTFQGQMKGLAKSVTGVAAAFGIGVSATGLIYALKRTADNLDNLAKTARTIGITTEALGGLRHAAEITGVSTDKLDTSLQRFAKRLGEAKMGTGEAKVALAALGLSVESLLEQKPSEQFSTIADRISKVGTAAEKAAITAKLFGREGVDLINTLNLGADGLKNMQQEAERLGLAFSEEKLTQVENMNDALTRLKDVMSGAWGQIVIAIAPEATKAIDDLRWAIEHLPGAKPRGMGGLSALGRASETAGKFGVGPGAPRAVFDRWRGVSRAIGGWIGGGINRQYAGPTTKAERRARGMSVSGTGEPWIGRGGGSGWSGGSGYQPTFSPDYYRPLPGRGTANLWNAVAAGIENIRGRLAAGVGSSLDWTKGLDRSLAVRFAGMDAARERRARDWERDHAKRVFRPAENRIIEANTAEAFRELRKNLTGATKDKGLEIAKANKKANETQLGWLELIANRLNFQVAGAV